MFKLVLLLVSLSVGIFAAHKNTHEEVIPGVVIVRVNTPVLLKHSGQLLADKVIRQYGITSMNKVFKSSSDFAKVNPRQNMYQDIYYVTFSGNQSPHTVAQALRKEAYVMYAEPKYIHYIDAIPDDSLYHLQSFYSQVKAPQAWDVARGEQGTAIIAVVDGGTEIHHPDLSANIWINPGETPYNGIDDDGNGFIDDCYGWNFANESGDPTGLPTTPSNAEHGTHTAGLIAAVSNNHIGIAGMSWNASLMAVNAGGAEGDDNIWYGFEGIIYAADNGADIISCSWGRTGGRSAFEQDVMQYATDRGAIVVAAAGNNNENLSHYPAAYQYVLSVAAVNDDDSKSSFSNYGETIDVAAPGTNILSTIPDFSYGRKGGTSMACPLAAGLTGLVKTQHPSWSGLQCGEQVRVTCDNIDGVNPPYVGMLGKGRINAYRALTESRPSICVTDRRVEDQDGNEVIEPGETIMLYLTVKNYLAPATNIQLILYTDDPFLVISDDFVTLDQLSTLESTETGPFIIEIDENAPAGYPARLFLEVVTGGQQDQFGMYLTILPLFGTLSINSIETTITNIGRLGFTYLGFDDEGVGFKYEGGANLLYEGAIITGTDAAHISNAARGVIGLAGLSWDLDFAAVKGGELKIINPGAKTDEESYAIFDDSQAGEPLNIRIIQETYAASDIENADFLLLKYTVENTGQQDLSNFHFGLFFDWDIDGFTLETNKIGFTAAHRLGFAYDSGMDGPGTYAGAALLTDGRLSFRAIMNDEAASANPAWGIYDGFSDAEKWEAISGGQTITKTTPGDVSFVIGSGPHLIRKNRFIELGFALMAGQDSMALVDHAQSAQKFWQELDLVDGVGDSESVSKPRRFTLEQNYPNPFNTATTISFSLAKRSYIQLDIYSIVGRHIITLVDAMKPSGAYSISWDGRDSKNRPVSSGIYLYQLQAGDHLFVRKLLVIK